MNLFLWTVIQSQKRQDPFILVQPKLISLAVLSSIYWLTDFNATRFQFFINFWSFRIIGPFLKSYPVILLLMAPIVLAKKFNGSVIKFSEKKFFGLNGLNTFLSHFSTEFLFFCMFLFFI